MSASPEPVIEVRDLTRRFGDKVALDEVSVRVPRGGVFGLVGPNGSGKTTLIKHALGLLKAQAGSVRVFGLDPVADPPGVLSRIGCLTEENDLPGWMRVDELMRFTKAFYPRWNDRLLAQILDRFELPRRAKLRKLSNGQRAQASLALDDPTSVGVLSRSAASRSR